MNSAFNGGNFLGGAIGGISYSGSLFTNKITSTDGVNTSYKYIISPDYNDEGSAIVDEWLIAKMDINSNEYQRGETDCVPTVGKVAAKYLGMDINVRDKQRAANNSGGIYANKTKEFFEGLGLKVKALQNGKGSYYFHEGIPDSMKTQAIKFIVESIQIGHPVFMGYNEIDGEQNLQGHAVLVKEIQYKSDYSTFKYITTWDPQYRSGTIKSFQNYHRVSQNVYNIFSFSKP